MQKPSQISRKKRSPPKGIQIFAPAQARVRQSARESPPPPDDVTHTRQGSRAVSRSIRRCWSMLVRSIIAGPEHNPDFRT